VRPASGRPGARPVLGPTASRPGGGSRSLLRSGATRTRTGLCRACPGRGRSLASSGHRDPRHGLAAPAAARTSGGRPGSHTRPRDHRGDTASHRAGAQRRSRAGRPPAHAGPRTHRRPDCPHSRLGRLLDHRGHLLLPGPDTVSSHSPEQSGDHPLLHQCTALPSRTATRPPPPSPGRIRPCLSRSRIPRIGGNRPSSATSR